MVRGCLTILGCPVATIFENLEDMNIEEVMKEYDVSREQIEAVLEFVAQGLKAPIVELA